MEQVTYKTLTPQRRNMIMVGLFLAMLAACLDGTIVGTVGTVIAQDLDGLGLFAWMTTAYMLCEAVMIPIAGKLSDIFGRRNLFLIGCIFFLVASILAAVSTSMEMFIVCRAIQGIGGGIIIPVVTASIADLYEPSRRARMQGIIGAIFGIGSGIGPLVGGALAEISWHWCFYINIPFTIAGILLTFYTYPKTQKNTDVHIDYWGIAVLTLLLLDVLLLLEFGGSQFEWMSLETAAMAVLAIILVVVFVFLERRAKDPVLAPHLLKNRTVILACIFMAIFGIGMMGSMMYTNMLVITVFGLSTIEAGLWSLPMVAGMMITSLLSGTLSQRTGYRFWLIIGPIIALCGLFILSSLDVTADMFVDVDGTITGVEYIAKDSLMWTYLGGVFVLGVGLGCLMAVVNSAVQNSSRPSEMGMTTSAVNLMRTIGMTLGTAIFAMVISTLLTGDMDSTVPGLMEQFGESGTGILDHLFEIFTMGFDMFTGTLVAFSESVTTTFLVGGVIIFLLVFVGIVFKVKVPDAEFDYAEPPEQPPEEGAGQE